MDRVLVFSLLLVYVLSCRTGSQVSSTASVSGSTKPTVLFVTNHEGKDRWYYWGQKIKQELQQCGFRVEESSLGQLSGALGLKLYEAYPLPEHTPIIFAGTHGDKSGNMEGWVTSSFIDKLRAGAFPTNPILVDTCYAGQCTQSGTCPVAVTCSADELSYVDNMFADVAVDLLCDSINKCTLFDEINAPDQHGQMDKYVDGREIQAWLKSRSDMRDSVFVNHYQNIDVTKTFERKTKSRESSIRRLRSDLSSQAEKCKLGGSVTEWSISTGFPLYFTLVNLKNHNISKRFLIVDEVNVTTSTIPELNLWIGEPRTKDQINDALLAYWKDRKIIVDIVGQAYHELNSIERADFSVIGNRRLAGRIELRCLNKNVNVVEAGKKHRSQTGYFPKGFRVVCNNQIRLKN